MLDHGPELSLDDDVDDGEELKTLWAFALSGNAAAGAVPYRMNFVCCHRLAGDPTVLEVGA